MERQQAIERYQRGYLYFFWILPKAQEAALDALSTLGRENAHLAEIIIHAKCKRKKNWQQALFLSKHLPI